MIKFKDKYIAEIKNAGTIKVRYCNPYISIDRADELPVYIIETDMPECDSMEVLHISKEDLQQLVDILSQEGLFERMCEAEVMVYISGHLKIFKSLSNKYTIYSDFTDDNCHNVSGWICHSDINVIKEIVNILWKLNI